jgi:hypothetical protein
MRELCMEAKVSLLLMIMRSLIRFWYAQEGCGRCVLRPRWVCCLWQWEVWWDSGAYKKDAEAVRWGQGEMLLMTIRSLMKPWRAQEGCGSCVLRPRWVCCLWKWDVWWDPGEHKKDVRAVRWGKPVTIMSSLVRFWRAHKTCNRCAVVHWGQGKFLAYEYNHKKSDETLASPCFFLWLWEAIRDSGIVFYPKFLSSNAISVNFWYRDFKVVGLMKLPRELYSVLKQETIGMAAGYRWFAPEYSWHK